MPTLLLSRSWAALCTATVGSVVFGLAAPSASAQLAPHGFIDFRYASRTPLTLFGFHEVNGAVVILGMVQHPGSGYREAVGGVGLRVSGHGWSALATPAVAHASDGWYGQLYVLPSASFERLAMSGVLVVYVPIEAEGVSQLHLNPLTVTRPLAGGRLRIGASYTLAAAAGRVVRQSVGPALAVSARRLTIAASFLAGIDGEAELRLSLTAPW